MRHVLMTLPLLWSCAAPEAPQPAAPPTPDPAEAGLTIARDAATTLGKTLKTRLQEAMSQGGPDAAIRVCADEAPVITKRVGDEKGVRVGRSSLRLRNPADAPPPWVAEWLTAQGERPAADASGFERVDGEGASRVARVLKPIPVEAACLGCHGAPDTLSEPVRSALAARYPTDAATGYAVGDLRGALWAEAPIAGAATP